jgi:hypothetical protein
MLNPSRVDSTIWPDVVIAAESSNEPFQEVTIVTARGMFLDVAMQAAAHICHEEGHTLTQDKVTKIARTLIAAEKIMVQEHVRVNSEGITVCLNVEDVEHEDVAWLAFDRVAQALDSLNGTHGVVTFGDNLRFSVDQATSLRVI